MWLVDKVHQFIHLRIRTPVTASILPKVVRRYIAINLYDGTLLAIGVVVSSMMLNLPPVDTIINGLLIGLSSAVSGFMGAFLIEHAELAREVQELEKHLFISIGRRQVYLAGLVLSLLNALSTPTPIILSLVPFVLAHFGFLSSFLAYITAFAAAFSMLLLLGFWLARIASGNRAKYTLLVISSGAIIVLIDLLLH
ncbi:hypothetical protein IG193_05210 [Infirmifilum lucidum]|uniref:VIT family protein n=1 Tax=Infirmifilum lucidum TaxID=2776706 RepID=A0A7L9FEX8_9CREN|nr:hypothetical protein [Infirmifilum lucidum]QOJ78181.1 hypothetical protein IG193_05210 [Infirmifilum lucidum]